MSRTTPNSDIENPSYDHNHGQEDAKDGIYNPPGGAWGDIAGRTPAEQERKDDYDAGRENYKEQTA